MVDEPRKFVVRVGRRTNPSGTVAPDYAATRVATFEAAIGEAIALAAGCREQWPEFDCLVMIGRVCDHCCGDGGWQYRQTTSQGRSVTRRTCCEPCNGTGISKSVGPIRVDWVLTPERRGTK